MGGPLGRLFEPIVAYQLNRIGPRTLAAFKYLVERRDEPRTDEPLFSRANRRS
jgi:hypothetical protein